ncbi:MAG: acylneuraminate cytidylyltransferase family protein [Candidatus Omnitrophica bacterium]|nr:acylneuraminate cytidylyltransferase family protein [Candidatus Omnitrophota bacterium]MDD5237447.1 acylneuraminate cytidylyltransferase family protein [Candidatus Omnitrophota bacterium]
MVKKNKNVVAVIPARAGSKGLPNKNILPLLGKPLIQYSIEVAKKAKLLDRIIVSTDSEQIADISRKSGAEVPFIRPKELAADFSSTEDVLKHAILWLKENEGYIVDILVYLQLTDFFKKSEWIDQAVKMLLEDETLESVFVAYPDYKNYWKKQGDDYVRITGGRHMARQLKERVYREDTGLASATRAYIITEQNRRLGDKVKIIENDEVTIDIHSEFDFWLVEKLFRERPEFKQYLSG